MIPLGKLLAKNVFAVAAAAASSVLLLLSAIALRPASAPASHACCNRTFTRYMRPKSTADPVSADIGIRKAASIASVLPPFARAKRDRNEGWPLVSVSCRSIVTPREPCP
ncbi:hypothetical protein WR25_22344 [Diploscapter pachys]|uniref:Uncharacterized protein n=1 Tax=Diploscapter pachys TaxID=2018661 RepID=A0A2A2M1V9_9BILA|nr:hypothetical protein WR25_22344 [Diploscapter pachys]